MATTGGHPVSLDLMKERAAQFFFDRYLKTGQYTAIGLGTGTTVEKLIPLLGIQMRGGANLAVVSTSEKTSRLARAEGIVVLENPPAQLALGVDGADEIEVGSLRAIKGGHGAMVAEKRVAQLCDHFVVIIDETKLVARLGEKFAVPVEAVPERVEQVQAALRLLGATACTVRQEKTSPAPFRTDSGNCVIDARFANIANTLENAIDRIDGVIGNGLFLTQVQEVIMTKLDGGVETQLRDLTARIKV